MVRNISICVVCALAFSFATAYAVESSAARQQHGDKEITVLRSDARSCVIEYRPSIHGPLSVPLDGSRFVRFRFHEASPLDPSAKPGVPDIPCRRVGVGVPTKNGNSVRVVSADYEDLPSMTLAPVPLLQTKNGMSDAAGYQMDQQAYAVSGFLPANPGSLGSISQSRGIFLGTITFAPVQYSPASKTVRKYSRIVVELTFGVEALAAPETPDSRLVGSMLVNGVVSARATSPALAKTHAVTSSLLASGKWYRIAVTDNGVYKLDAVTLSAAGIPVSSIDPRTMKIYGNGGREVPEDISSTRPIDLVENAIYVSGEADGKFDAGDYVLFYGCSPRDWMYDSSAHALRHYLNHYTETNYYWLTYDGVPGKRMAAQQSETGSGVYTPDRFRDGAVVEEEKIKPSDVSSGKDWYARLQNSQSPTFTYVVPLPGLVPSDQLKYRFSLFAHTTNGGTYTVREGSTILGVYSMYPVYGYSYLDGGIVAASGTSSLSSQNSQIGLTFGPTAVSDEGYVDWVEVNYPRFFFAVNNYLRFWSPDTTAFVEYNLQQFAAAPMIFNVTKPESVTVISGVAGAYMFRGRETTGHVSQYVAAAPSAWKIPGTIQSVANQDLRGFSTGGDFIILTSSEFRSAADRLAAFREQVTHGNLRTVVVDVSQIYNEFSGGLPDVTALRDYLKYAYDNWTRRAQFVLLLGGASYDYKGLLGSRSNYVPTWQSDESTDDVESYSTDDYFAKFGSDNTPSLVLGRISSRTAGESDIVVDKIMRYETESTRDTWKSRIVFIGDDAYTTELGEIGDRTLHSDDAETLATGYTPDEFEKKKIFIAEYPTVWTTLGRTKPGAYQAIIDQINQGVLVLNYSGHGNPIQLAHENIFNVETSIPQLVNNTRLSVFFLATCNFSQFDDPKRYTGSELLLNKVDGGACGVLSACRKVYQGANASLNQGTYRAMFARDTHGRLLVDRPAAALFAYKVAGGNFKNDQKFLFMGDPTMRLQFPSGFASIDSINGERADSLNGAPRTKPIQMKSLSRVTVIGTIRDAGGAIDPAFTGTVQLQVNDANHTQTIVDFYPGSNWSYLATGSLVFRGLNSVSNGKFRASFLVPKDIAFADSTGRGRLSAYYYNDAVQGNAYTGNILISGTDTTVSHDQNGPQISVYLNSRMFRQGDNVSQDPALLVDLADSNGINTSSDGIGHRIEAWLNNSPQPVDLTAFYTSKLDNYREGTVQYQLSNLPMGKNTLRVRAWDSFNNSNSSETTFEVSSDQALSISDVMNYPNPFASTTQFTFRQNRLDPLKVKINIYTVAGRLIHALAMTTGGEPFIRIPWDGRDRDGDILANGVYLYKLVASTVDGQFTSEAIGKIAVLK